MWGESWRPKNSCMMVPTANRLFVPPRGSPSRPGSRGGTIDGGSMSEARLYRLERVNEVNLLTPGTYEVRDGGSPVLGIRLSRPVPISVLRDALRFIAQGGDIDSLQASVERIPEFVPLSCKPR